MGTKVQIQPTKTKLKYDTKAGDKMNIDLQGYLKNQNLFTKDPLKGSQIKGKVKWKKGRHSVEGTASYRPDGESNIGAKYTLKFNEGSKGKTIGKELTNRQMINKLYKENPANPQIKKAWAASQSDIENWENMVPIKLKNKYFKKAGK